jgi:hypothetical protein
MPYPESGERKRATLMRESDGAAERMLGTKLAKSIMIAAKLQGPFCVAEDA